MLGKTCPSAGGDYSPVNVHQLLLTVVMCRTTSSTTSRSPTSNAAVNVGRLQRFTLESFLDSSHVYNITSLLQRMQALVFT